MCQQGNEIRIKSYFKTFLQFQCAALKSKMFYISKKKYFLQEGEKKDMFVISF